MVDLTRRLDEVEAFITVTPDYNRSHVSFPRYHLLLDERENLLRPDEPAAAAREVLDQLHWWAHALTAARTTPEAA